MALLRCLNFVDQGISFEKQLQIPNPSPGLCEVPSHIFFACDTVVELHVSSNFLTVIPSEISLLRNLRGLFLSNNKIRYFCEL